MDAKVKLIDRTNAIFEDYKHQGFSSLPHNISRETFEEVNGAFVGLRQIISQESIDNLNLRLRKKYGEIGLYGRDSKKDDTKIFMHYNPFLEGRFDQIHKYLSVEEVFTLERLFEPMREIYEVGEGIAREIITGADLLFDGLKDKYITLDNRMTCFYRLLEYPYDNQDFSQAKNKNLADEHTDFSSFTLAFYESTPGLMMARGLDETSYIAVEHEDGKLMTFPGRTITRINETLEPSLHKVVKVPGYNLEKSRFAHVFFVNPIDEFNQEMVKSIPYIKR